MILDDERKVLKITFILSVTAVVFQFIGFVGNGLDIRYTYGKGILSYEGLWYRTECNDDDEGCETLSTAQWFKRRGWSLHGLSYSQHIRQGLLLTMALCCCIICVILPVIRWRDKCSGRQMRLGVIVNSIISGLYWLYEVGLRLRLLQVFSWQSEFIFYFPYSTVSALVGVILVITVGCLCLICECRVIGIEDNRISEQSDGKYEGAELQPITEGDTYLPLLTVDEAFSYQEPQDVKPLAQDIALPDLTDNIGSGDGRDEELEYLRARLQEVDNKLNRKKLEAEKKRLRTEIEQKERELECFDKKVNKPIIRYANLQGYITRMSRQRMLQLIGLILSVLSTIFQIIAFASNGWKIVGDYREETRIGIWYYSKCKKQCEECDVVCDELPINKEYDKPKLAAAHSYVLRGQLCLTIAVCCCISCVVLLVLSIIRPNIYRRAKIAIMIQAIVSGAVWLCDTGMALREFHVAKQNAYYESSFPWSALVGMFGGLCVLVLGFGCFPTEFVRQEKKESLCLEEENLQLRTI